MFLYRYYLDFFYSNCVFVPGPLNSSLLCDKAAQEKWAIWNLKSGLGSLPLTIKNKLIGDGVKIKSNTTCSQLERTQDGFIVSFF